MPSISLPSAATTTPLDESDVSVGTTASAMSLLPTIVDSIRFYTLLLAISTTIVPIEDALLVLGTTKLLANLALESVLVGDPFSAFSSCPKFATKEPKIQPRNERYIVASSGVAA
jgi:hypothetical protein